MGWFVKQLYADREPSLVFGKNIPRVIDVGVSIFTGVGDLIYESKEKLH